MWVFALYELLRTWRGWAAELGSWAGELAAAEDKAAALAAKRTGIERRAQDGVEADGRWQAFEQVASTPEFTETLRSASIAHSAHSETWKRCGCGWQSTRCLAAVAPS
jgi:hypothetical protein